MHSCSKSKYRKSNSASRSSLVVVKCHLPNRSALKNLWRLIFAFYLFQKKCVDYKKQRKTMASSFIHYVRLITVAILAIQGVTSEVQDLCEISGCSCTPSPLRDDLTDVNCQCSSSEQVCCLLKQFLKFFFLSIFTCLSFFFPKWEVLNCFYIFDRE